MFNKYKMLDLMTDDILYLLNTLLCDISKTCLYMTNKRFYNYKFIHDLFERYTKAVYAASVELGKEKGVFPIFNSESLSLDS